MWWKKRKSTRLRRNLFFPVFNVMYIFHKVLEKMITRFGYRLTNQKCLFRKRHPTITHRYIDPHRPLCWPVRIGFFRTQHSTVTTFACTVISTVIDLYVDRYGLVVGTRPPDLYVDRNLAMDEWWTASGAAIIDGHDEKRWIKTPRCVFVSQRHRPRGVTSDIDRYRVIDIHTPLRW